MALFQVEGWDLKDQVAISRPGDKKKQKNKEKKEKRKAELAKRKEDDKKASQEPDNEEMEAKNVEAKDESTGEVKQHKRKAEDLKDERVKAQNKAEDIDETNKNNKKKNNNDNNNRETSKKRKHDEVEQSKISPIAPVSNVSKLTPLQQKMLNKLSGSRFRWINEQLYTISSEDALALIKNQPELFDEYHQGFKSQVQSWPQNPVDVFVEEFKTRGSNKPVNAPGGLPGFANKKVVVADMGCGEAQFAKDIEEFVESYNNNKQKKFKRNGGGKFLDVKVHSFDLKKHNERITVADIAHVPLPDQSCNVVIFCLALMGTNFLDFIQEALRILAPRGELWIAEIKSRFNESTDKKSINQDNVGEEFVNTLKLLGFFHKSTDNSNSHFTRFEFFKPQRDILDERNAKLQRKQKFVEQETEKEQLDEKRGKKAEGQWLLKPCIYKRR